MKKVHFVYIVPRNEEVSELKRTAIQQCALHLQAWYRWQMNGKTFALSNPIVEILNADKDSGYFTTPVPEDNHYWYWNATIHEARSIGAGFDQPDHRWMLYIDVFPENQSAGGTHGMAVLSGRDIAGLAGTGDWSVCRSIGGSGHELGHTFGLPHPHREDPLWNKAIMGVGFSKYSDCILTPSDKATLKTNPFFETCPAMPPKGLCPFRTNPRPRPKPKPRPRA